jgi:hypothetical protein
VERHRPAWCVVPVLARFGVGLLVGGLASILIGTASAGVASASRPRVVLVQGVVGGDRWRATASTDGDLPCFGIRTPEGGASVCGQPRRAFVPLVEAPVGHGGVRRTILLIAASNRVRTVDFAFYGGMRRVRQLKAMSETQANRLNLAQRVRFAPLVVRRSACLKRHVDYTRHHHVYYRSQHYDC